MRIGLERIGLIIEKLPVRLARVNDQCVEAVSREGSVGVPTLDIEMGSEEFIEGCAQGRMRCRHAGARAAEVGGVRERW
jgi:hypothetical protein